MKKIIIIAIILCVANIVFLNSYKQAQCDSFHFIVFGDPQPVSEVADYNPITYKMIKEINLWDPMFVVNLGDSIFGVKDRPGHAPKGWVLNVIDKQFIKYKKLTYKIKAKTYQIPGNHDVMYSKGIEKLYKKHFGDLYYSFDYNGVHFVALNSENTDLEKRINSKQIEWLEKDLSKNKDKMIFVFVHRPLYPKIEKYSTLKNADEMHKLFIKYNVKYVFSGHLHHYNQIEKDGVNYYTTGGAGGPFFPGLENSFYHYLVVGVEGDNVKIEVRKL